MIKRKTRRRKKAAYASQPMLLLIGVLAVLLVVAVIVAGSIGQNGKTQSSDATQETQSQIGLTVQEPSQQTFVTLQQQLTFSGTSDPNQVLTIAGEPVNRNADGSFVHTLMLSAGKNEITVSHKEQTLHYSVEYRYAVEKYAPMSQASFNSAAAMPLAVSARAGSQVTAQFHGKQIVLKPQENAENAQVAPGFVQYTASYTMPVCQQDTVLGVITYTVTCNGLTETYTSGSITCLKRADILTSDPTATPDYGKYLDVGSGYIAEIVTYSAETFDGATRNDYSDPRNNYLPLGTMDYTAKDAVYDSTGKISYRLLRCGYRVYTEHKNYPPVKINPVVNCYRGMLPDHNEIGFVSLTVSEKHTVLTLDTLWKAPFYLDVAPQAYSDTEARDFTVTDLTAQYIDITFCYATKFTGTAEVAMDNPLFSKAQLTQRESDCTLRLFLKQKGRFYGWDSYYNADGQLCFQFLNPSYVKAADNVYGADLTGVRIMLDVGHGGMDGGSPVTDANGKTVEEAECNLALAKILKTELERMGATVIMNRTDDSALSVDARNQFLKDKAPDLCIAIHQNAYKPLASVNGCDVIYFGPTSQAAATEIFKEISESGVYEKTKLKWGVYYVARQSVCPVVLVECGYMTNPQDLAGMLNPDILQRKAQDMARGVANYFFKES